MVTGVLLALMEALNVHKRLRTISFLRSMVEKPSDVLIYRNMKWSKSSSSELLPGDIFELTGNSLIPCDAILLSGGCVVNESSLTGENVALLKDNISGKEGEEVFSISKHKTHLLFGGTKCIQVSTGTTQTPHKGVTAIAVRTGFSSSQGKVLRTIAFASENVSVNSKEALYFILFLLCFAIVAAGYVLMEGLKDAEKSRYKLLLECVLILTSVIPPELPLELALAVTASLMALKTLGM